MNKVHIFDKRLLKKAGQIFTFITGVISFILLFVDIPRQHKIMALIIVLVILLIAYFIYWCVARKQRRILLKFGESEVEVYFGDIFRSNSEDLKVISFNEYFDTQVGGKNQIISPGTINGKYLTKFKDKIPEIDALIRRDKHLNSDMALQTEFFRRKGMKKRFRLGSLIELPDNYIAVAGSKFDRDNRANTTMKEYIGFLLTFWSEVDRIYNNRSVVIPVFGSGILRFTDGYEGASAQDLLEIIIWTFKISRIKIEYPSRIKIVVFENKSDKYNLIKLKEIEKDGL